MIDNEVCIVTAFKDLGRASWVGSVNGVEIPHYIKRDNITYFERFKRLTKLNNKIICYIDDNLKDDLEKFVGVRENVVYIPINDVLNLFEAKYNYELEHKISKIQQNPAFVSLVDNKSSPEYWNPGYVLINYYKSFFVDHTIQHVNDEYNNYAWIDFGYCRSDYDAVENKTFVYDTQNRITLFMNGDQEVGNLMNRPIFDIIKTGDVLIQGCHIVGHRSQWMVLKTLMHNQIMSLMKNGLIDDDQTMLLMSFREFYRAFRLVPGSSTYWFTVIRVNLI